MEKSGLWRNAAWITMTTTPDETFLEEMVMNANVVKRDFLRVMQDSVSISQYLCIVALVVIVWIHTLDLVISEGSLLLLDSLPPWTQLPDTLAHHKSALIASPLQIPS
ncbi:hypothetical protein J5N97_029736 [Dioscorea zingiberensis]|uniref:Uncharacterized protein n=1 Tax=Dioscorea zingiberensis TaxID=325984 RepID=A0A9D5H3H1_9LILI|nr:hypothetical protein J5N97_029736 [Dioscorea zingiberensis]